jgi:hypothetical protein
LYAKGKALEAIGRHSESEADLAEYNKLQQDLEVSLWYACFPYEVR